MTLSDKIKVSDAGNRLILVRHVKEFIKELKETLCNELYERNRGLDFSGLDRIPQKTIIKEIDKLAGEKLT